MKTEKLDYELQRAMQERPGPFSIIVRFTHLVTDDDAASLHLMAGGDTAVGRATVDQIEKIADRDDVMSVALRQQPRASGKN